MAHHRDEAADLALKGGAIVAKVFGLREPVAATLGVLIDAIRDHRAKRQFQRLERLVKLVEARLERFEGSFREPQEPDLLQEILADSKPTFVFGNTNLLEQMRSLAGTPVGS